MTENWKTISDDAVHHIWECPECDNSACVQPWFYSEMGEPFCADCECEMEYIRTEVNLA